jgi:hypothetical protein
MADTSAQLRKGAWARTVYSEKRKEQNRIASKVYRMLELLTGSNNWLIAIGENRKRKLQMLNTVIALPTLGANSGDSQSPTPDSAWSMSTDFAIATNHSKHLGPHFLEQQLNVAEFLTNKASAAVPSSETQAKLTKRVSACFLSLRTDQRRRLFTLIRENGLKFVDTLRLLLDPRMNTAESDSLAIYGLFRDIDAMSKLPDLHVNNFHILQASYFAAIYANAQALGFQFDDYLNDDSVSPLTCIHASTDDPTGLRTAMAQYASAPRGLQPQETQIIQTHHPYLVRHSSSLSAQCLTVVQGRDTIPGISSTPACCYQCFPTANRRG